MRKLIVIVVLAWAAVSLFSAYSSASSERTTQAAVTVPR